MYVPASIGYYRSGLGQATPTFGQNLGRGITSGAQMGVGTAISTKDIALAAAAGTLATIAPFTGPAAPFLMAAAALIGPIAQLFKGCGQSCIEATKYANQAQEALDKLKADYFNQPVHYASSQAGTLGLMEQVFGYLQQGCSSVGGAAGERCISERLVRGGSAPWCPTHTGCDVWSVYYDPVKNDPNVVPDPVADTVLSSIGVNPSTQVFGVPLSKLLLPAALLIGLLAFGGDD